MKAARDRRRAYADLEALKPMEFKSRIKLCSSFALERVVSLDKWGKLTPVSLPTNFSVQLVGLLLDDMLLFVEEPLDNSRP
ncbi:hypothetical protein Tco_1228846 [Tanacetum coccineum]